MQPILKIDLTARTIRHYPIPHEWERQYLGGASMAARLLYDSLTRDLDPLSPNAPLLFLNGPLSGSAGPAVGRFVICGKSPATGLWAESNCGGFWGPELRKAGYDGLWITGRAQEPVYLWIQDQQVDIRPAAHLWGMQTYETQAALEAELEAPRPRIAVIGPAGEAAMPFALILTDHGRVAGRTGMGAVMGAKNLKAVAVKGSGDVPIFDTEGFKTVRTDANKALRTEVQSGMLRELGSAGPADYFDYLGTMPKRYYSQVNFSGAGNISGAHISETILEGVSACHACVIACGRVVRLPQEHSKQKGPEYETLVGFGPNLLIDDPVFATRMGDLCDRYGMDSISLSNTLGLVMALYEQGLIDEQAAAGVKPVWGDREAVEQLVMQTVRQEGLGIWIARGARALGRHFGAGDRAVQVNGLELPYHDPRGASGMALVYATSPRGGCHNQSDYFLVDIGQVETELGLEFYDRHAGAEKAANVAIHQDWRTLWNSLVLCIFANVPPATILELINTACGYDWDIQDMLRAGERGWNLKRAINNRLGLDRGCDRLPKAMLEPYSDDDKGSLGYSPNLEPMLQAYYAARGWDEHTGYPRREKLHALGLDWVATDLWQEENDAVR